jgi:hypothetical protein
MSTPGFPAQFAELSAARSKNSPMILTALLSPFAPTKVRTDMITSCAGVKGDSRLAHALLVQRFDAQRELIFDGDFQVYSTV